MAINPQTGLQQFGFFKKIAKKLLKPPGGSKFIKKTLMPPGLKKSLEYSLLPHRALGMSERDLLMPHRALGMSERDLLMPHRALRREKDRGIGGLPRGKFSKKLLEVDNSLEAFLNNSDNCHLDHQQCNLWFHGIHQQQYQNFYPI
jgi:hypothetical protein